MATLASNVDARAEETGGQVDSGARRRRLFDLGAVLVYVLGAFYVTARLWFDLDHRIQASNEQDHGFFQFVLTNAARSLVHLDNPLFSSQINVPDGVNMMANTSILGLAIPLAPVTLLFGVNVSYTLLVMIALSANATAWYWLFSRHLVTSRAAAFIAALFCGFAPGFVSQANGHPNVAGQFMVPIILYWVAKLRTSERPWRTGIVLGLLITYQAFINEEVLLFIAITGLIMTLVYGVSHRDEFRRILKPAVTGLGVAAGVALLLLAYPLWFQFFGPQHYGAVPALSVTYYSDLGSYFSYASESLAGAPFRDRGLHAHPAEENAYFGWPLLILCAVTTVLLWRNVLVRIAAAVGLVFGSLSLGPMIKIYGHNTGLHSPFSLINELPVLESIVPVRLAIMVTPAVAVLLALALDKVITAPRTVGGPRVLWYAGFAAALLPIMPTPLPARDVPAAPAFVTQGMWKQYVGPGDSVVTVPLANIGNLAAQRWSAQVDLDMPIAGGYFLGPARSSDPRARALYGQPSRPTAELLDLEARTGKVPVITDADRRNIVADLRHWHAGVVILGDVKNRDILLSTMRELLGPPQFVGGVWMWDVRSMVKG
ncbi:hypothetical protein R8Z50_28355 [Longispora sp. K20-0274]|uniref:hypothetical protein n=1 Tax=Longispora sp. K20-0274 TaxID=3088255 RepID=UPI00399B58AE